MTTATRTKMKGTQLQLAREKREWMKSFDFGFTSPPINHNRYLSWLARKNETDSGKVKVLIWELLSLPNVNDRNLEFKFAKNTQRCLINVPMHQSEKGLLVTFGQKDEKWIDAIIRQAPENAEDGAQ
jgi:hypothetical protein